MSQVVVVVSRRAWIGLQHPYIRRTYPEWDGLWEFAERWSWGSARREGGRSVVRNSR